MKPKNIKAVFRRSMHGYNKKDVNDYIVRLSRDFFEKEQRMKADLRKAETDALLSGVETDTIFKLREENDRLSSLVEELRRANAELRKKLTEKSAIAEPPENVSPLANAISVDLFAGGFSPLRSEDDSVAALRAITEKIKSCIKIATDFDSDELMESIDREMSKVEELLHK